MTPTKEMWEELLAEKKMLDEKEEKLLAWDEEKRNMTPAEKEMLKIVLDTEKQHNNLLTNNFLTDKTFYFVSAERLRKHEGRLPKFQEMRSQGGWLHEQDLSIHDVIEKAYVGKFLAVSHRWIKHYEPFDFNGSSSNKFSKLVEFLNAHLEIEFVWLDWCCIPQEVWNEDRTKKIVERTEIEKKLFQETLPSINYLYLSMSVVQLIDKDYMERFWTLFELFLSFQDIGEVGLCQGKGDRHYSVFLEDVHGASDKISSWSACSVEKTIEKLAGDEVQVTNKSDKTICLQKLSELDMCTGDLHRATTACMADCFQAMERYAAENGLEDWTV